MAGHLSIVAGAYFYTVNDRQKVAFTAWNGLKISGLRAPEGQQDVVLFAALRPALRGR